MAEASYEIADSIKDILNKYPGVFEVIHDGKKLKCHLTNHELNMSQKSLEDYVGGKKFQRLYNKLKSPKNYIVKVESKYKDFFVPSKNSKSRLYCTLTKKEVNNLPHALEKYTSGYKFMKAFYFHKQKALASNSDDNILEKDITMEVESDNENSCIEDPFYALSDEEYSADDIEEVNGEMDRIDDDDENDEDIIIDDSKEEETLILEDDIKERKESTEKEKDIIKEKQTTEMDINTNNKKRKTKRKGGPTKKSKKTKISK